MFKLCQMLPIYIVYCIIDSSIQGMEAQEMQVVAHNIMAEYTVGNVSY